MRVSQKEIDINTEVLQIVNSEIVKVTEENVQKVNIYQYRSVRGQLIVK